MSERASDFPINKKMHTVFTEARVRVGARRWEEQSWIGRRKALRKVGRLVGWLLCCNQSDVFVRRMREGEGSDPFVDRASHLSNKCLSVKSFITAGFIARLGKLDGKVGEIRQFAP